MSRPIQVWDEKAKKFVWRNIYPCQGQECEQALPVMEAGKVKSYGCKRDRR
jgi:hypothetical protein